MDLLIPSSDFLVCASKSSADDAISFTWKQNKPISQEKQAIKSLPLCWFCWSPIQDLDVLSSRCYGYWSLVLLPCIDWAALLLYWPSPVAWAVFLTDLLGAVCTGELHPSRENFQTSRWSSSMSLVSGLGLPPNVLRRNILLEFRWSTRENENCIVWSQNHNVIDWWCNEKEKLQRPRRDRCMCIKSDK